MSGMVEAAGGVLSARSNSSTKNATKTFIPEMHVNSIHNINCSKQHLSFDTIGQFYHIYIFFTDVWHYSHWLDELLESL